MMERGAIKGEKNTFKGDFMGPFEIVTLVVVGVAVAGVLVYLIRKKLKGGSIGCDCGSCSACPHCTACKTRNNAKSVNTEEKR